MADERPQAQELLGNIKRDLAGLEVLLDDTSDRWTYEDPIYRFWHQSMKVYAIQDTTARMVDALRSLAPSGTALNPWFEQIVTDGTGKTFELADNQRWLDATRPMLEAFFHARFMVEMTVRYGRELEEPPSLLPSGWAALLYLYGLR
jgi:hypothetical protein